MSGLYVETTDLEEGTGYIAQQLLTPLLGPVITDDHPSSKKCEIKLGLVYCLEDTGHCVLLRNTMCEDKAYRLTQFLPLKGPLEGSVNLFDRLIIAAKEILKETFHLSMKERKDDEFQEKVKGHDILCYRAQDTLYFGMVVRITEEELYSLKSNLVRTPIEVVTSRLNTLFNQVQKQPHQFDWDTHLVLLQL